MANKIIMKVGDKPIEFWFGLGAIGQTLEDMGIGINELLEKIQSNPYFVIPKLMYNSMKHGFDRVGQESGFSYLQFVDLLDESGGVTSEVSLKFIENFTKSMTKDVPKTPEPKKVGKGKKPVSEKK